MVSMSVLLPCTSFAQLPAKFPEAWGQICEAEKNLRKHESLQIRRQAESAYLRGEPWAAQFNPDRPWEIVFLPCSMNATLHHERVLRPSPQHHAHGHQKLSPKS